MGHQGKGSEGVEPRELTPDEQLKEYQSFLAQPEVDWDKYYIELRCSPLGNDYSPDVFVRTPISHINALIREARLRECEEANRLSHSTARLATLVISVAQGFAGVKDTSKVPEAKVFLPYPDIDKYRDNSKASGPTPETVEVLKVLLREQRIPMQVFTSLVYPQLDPR